DFLSFSYFYLFTACFDNCKHAVSSLFFYLKTHYEGSQETFLTFSTWYNASIILYDFVHFVKLIICFNQVFLDFIIFYLISYILRCFFFFLIFILFYIL